MGTIIVQEETTLHPIELIGKEAGICWGADVEDPDKNRRRGRSCLKDNHGRTLEFPQVFLTINGYSARVMRELYTHIGGAPTRLQASTRYIDYTKLYTDKEYVVPKKILDNPEALNVYDQTMCVIARGMEKLEKEHNIPREDIAMLLPLGMNSKMVLRTNLRNLIDMSHQRLCSRANWEFRELFTDIMNALKQYSSEWDEIITNTFVPKCRVLGYCPESHSCGAYEKTRLDQILKTLKKWGYKIEAPDELPERLGTEYTTDWRVKS